MADLVLQIKVATKIREMKPDWSQAQGQGRIKEPSKLQLPRSEAEAGTLRKEGAREPGRETIGWDNQAPLTNSYRRKDGDFL